MSFPSFSSSQRVQQQAQTSLFLYPGRDQLIGNGLTVAEKHVLSTGSPIADSTFWGFDQP